MTGARRWASFALGCYPPSFRERYGAEIHGLVEDTDVGARTVADLIVGAARAWRRAVVPAQGPDRARRRLQATAATTWACWCAGFLVTPAINRALLDPTPAHTPSGVQALLNTALAVIAVSAALVVVAAFPVLRVLLAAVRRRETSIIRPLFVPVALVAVVALGLAGLAAWRRTYPPIAQNPHFSGLFIGALAVWALAFVLALVAAGLGPALATTRAAPPLAALRLPGLLALPIAVLLTLATAVSATAVGLMLRTARADGVGPGALALTAAVVLCAGVASAVAVTTASRGLPAALQTTRALSARETRP
jgi:hypothetical protein